LLKDLATLENPPEIPQNWNYEESVAKVRQLIYKWATITEQLLNELYIAKHILSAQGRRTDFDAKASKLPTWTQYCLDIQSDRRVIDKWIKRWLISKGIKPTELPQAIFSVIYADPPWQYDFSKSTSRSIESHYPTMPLRDICELPIPADLNAILFLWATNPKIREALTVIESWGFEYRTNMVWVKDKIGMGYYVRGQHELLLIARKGELPPPDEANRVASVLYAPRVGHSRKPDTVYGIIEKMYPNQHYIELFATQKREGWESWGNKVE